MTPFCVVCSAAVVSYCHHIEKLKFAKITLGLLNTLLPGAHERHLDEVGGQIHHDALSGSRDPEILLHFLRDTCVPYYGRWVLPPEVPPLNHVQKAISAPCTDFKGCKALEWISKSSILLAV